MAPRSARLEVMKFGNASRPVATERSCNASEQDPHRLFILPRNPPAEVRIVSLSNPATRTLCRYLYCPQIGLYEFTRIGVASDVPRSLLVIGDQEAIVAKVETVDALQHEEPMRRPDPEEPTLGFEQGYVLRDPEIIVATPMDPLFLLMPIVPHGKTSEKNTLYRLEEEFMEILSNTSLHMKELLVEERFKRLLLSRLDAISETKNIDSATKVYRPDPLLLLHELVQKANAVVGENAWPASLEGKFVQTQLTASEDVVTSEQAAMKASKDLHSISTDSDDVVATAPTPVLEIRACSKSETSHDDSNMTSSTPEAGVDMIKYGIPEQVVNLLRTRVVLTFLMSSYLPKGLQEHLQQILALNTVIDFRPVDKLIEAIRKKESEARALRTLSDNISRKRSQPEDKEDDGRMESKRRKEEEEKRKKAQSRALKKLEKVNTSGMQKMSSFFSKKTSAA